MRILKACADVAAGRGLDLYLVGGAVRDVVLGRVPLDPDIDMAGPGVDRGFASDVAEALGGRFVASSAFGTYKLVVPDAAVGERGDRAEIEIDLVTSRSETYAEPGALPEVSPGTLADDLSRRDFSIGAIAMVMAPPMGSEMTWGDLIDPFDGEGDLSRKLVRVLHPNSFADDPTRIFRAVRYAVRLGFELESTTATRLEDGLRYIDRLSGDRVRHELERIFVEERAGEVLGYARELGVLGAVLPEMGGDDAPLTSAEFPDGPDGWDAWIGLLAYPVPPGRTQALVARLNLGSRMARVVRDVAGIRYGYHGLRSGLARPSEIYSFLSYRSEASIRACAAATEDETLRSALMVYLDDLMGTASALTGDDLIELGVPQGPVVGQLLRELLYARLDGRVVTIEDEKQMVRGRLVAG